MTKMLKRSLAGLLGGAMLFSMALVFPEPDTEVNAASICKINTNKTYQTIKGFGGINLREWTGYDLTDAEVQRAFGNGEKELGMSILRIFVNDDRNQWNKAIPVAQKAQKLGATVFATPWNPPASMRTNGNGKPRGGKYVLKDGAEGQYAKHLNDFIKYCEGQGVNLYSVAVQNEPDWSGEWTYWSPERAANFMANYGKQVTEGTKAKLMSPESFSYSKDYYNAILNNKQAFENCGLFGTHFYGTQRNAMDFPALENCGKDIWMTEVYVPDSKVSCEAYPQSLDQSENIHNGLVVGNMNAYVVWYIKRNYGPLNESGQISKRGYCMAQYSKYVRPGDVRIDATEQPESNILVSAFKHSAEQIEIVAINKGNGEVTQQFSVDGRSITNVDRYRTSANENIAPTKGMEYSGSSFYAQLPSKSVSTFIVSLKSDGVQVPSDPEKPVVTEPLKPDENGYYFHDTFEGNASGWTGHGSSDVTLSGRTHWQGAESLLIQNREKSWNGAEKDLDSNTFKAGTAYSISVCAAGLDGESVQNFKMSLQYTDSNGETKYTDIAAAQTVKGEFVQLANQNFRLPENGKNFKIYVETESGTDNFYIDEAIVAVAGTAVNGPEGVKITSVRGDLDGDGRITVADLTILKSGVINGFRSESEKLNADVDQSREVNAADAVYVREYLLGIISEFPVNYTGPAISDTDKAKYESAFSGLTLTKSWKYDGENNPLTTQRFGADPGWMVYDGRLYIYTTNDAFEYNNGNMRENSYDVGTINCVSTADMVNWTDHGAIPVAGRHGKTQGGAAAWAGRSWAPDAAWKMIDGKPKFFLYFANNGSGIGVLTADSPTGPWKDPIGHELISRSTPNCGNVAWLFDPGVYYDEATDEAYLFFGGGKNDNDGTGYDNPKTGRVVKLGKDMISLDGAPQITETPYLFEDSSLIKIGNTWYYSFCANWHVPSGTNINGVSFGSADICYMTSSNPLGPWNKSSFKGMVFRNTGSQKIDNGGNNHHSIIYFKDKYYVAYHARQHEMRMGVNGGKGFNYRSTQINEATFNAGNGTITRNGDMKGVSAIDTLDPYKRVEAETMQNQAGINVRGVGNTVVTDVNKGDWIRVTNVKFDKKTAVLKAKAGSKNGGVIKVCTKQNGDAVAYIDVPAGDLREVEVPVFGDLSGTTDLYFIFSADGIEFDYWQFS